MDDMLKKDDKLPSNGTTCKFTYQGKVYMGKVIDGALSVEGMNDTFNSFSGASAAITNTSRNGWNDWYLLDDQGGWTLASDWRNVLRQPGRLD